MTTCPICNIKTTYLGDIDFDKNVHGIKLLTPLDIKVSYEQCNSCGIIIAPEIYTWDKSKFSKLIYNDEYILVDPDHTSRRASVTANNLFSALHSYKDMIHHIDYGGGNGELSKILVKKGFYSVNYDPFYNPKFPIRTFDLITAIEVFEHHPNPIELINDLNKLSSKKSITIFTTAVCDNIDDVLDWDYTAPRNGHITIYTTLALKKLFNKIGFQLFHIQNSTFAAYKELPNWAKKVF